MPKSKNMDLKKIIPYDGIVENLMELREDIPNQKYGVTDSSKRCVGLSLDIVIDYYCRLALTGEKRVKYDSFIVNKSLLMFFLHMVKGNLALLEGERRLEQNKAVKTAMEEISSKQINSQNNKEERKK